MSAWFSDEYKAPTKAQYPWNMKYKIIQAYSACDTVVIQYIRMGFKLSNWKIQLNYGHMIYGNLMKQQTQFKMKMNNEFSPRCNLWRFVFA